MLLLLAIAFCAAFTLGAFTAIFTAATSLAVTFSFFAAGPFLTGARSFSATAATTLC